MSAYSERQTQYKDVELLVSALKACGITEVLVHKTPQRLEGYHGDLREQTADIIIPRRAVGHASNDIGFKLQPDGTYKAIISDYDRATHYNDAWVNKLTDTYTEHGVLKCAKKKGLRSIGSKIVNGKLQHRFVKA